MTLFAKRTGFTLIELLVVMVLIGVTVVTGIAGYRKFNTRQQVVTSGKELLVTLRQAQSKALSNVKTVPGCQDTPLVGYRLDGSGNSYTLREVYTVACVTGGGNYIIKTVNLPSGINFSSAVTLTFTGLSGGVAFAGASPLVIDFCNKGCQAGGLKYTIAVSKQGLIQDRGTTDL